METRWMTGRCDMYYTNKVLTVIWATVVLLGKISTAEYSPYNETFEKYPVVLKFDGGKLCSTTWSSSQVETSFKSEKLSGQVYPISTSIMLKCDFQFKDVSVCKLAQLKWLFNTFSVCIDTSKLLDSVLQKVLHFHLTNIYETNNHNLLKRPFSSKYIVFDFYKTPQEALIYTFTRFPRMRDYHTNPFPYGPMFVSNKIVADALNATLLAEPSAQDYISLDLVDQLPIINPAVQLYESSNNTVEIFWRKYRYSHPDETAQLVRVQSMGFNFGYCDIRNINTEKPWNISVLISGFDAYIWKALVLAMLCISVVIQLLNTNILCPRFNTLSYITILYSVSTALISVAPSGSTGVKKSTLFVLWMFVCIAVVNYYTGSITSLLISPPSENVMTEIFQAVDRNYSLIFDDPAHFAIVNATARNHFQGDTGLQRQGPMKSVISLLDKMGNHPKFINKSEYARTIAYTPKTITIYLWTFVLSTINIANALIAQEQPIASKRRHCYVGKHLLPSADTYVGLVLPGSERMRDVFNAMLDSGLFSYWYTESLKLGYARRVQDRSKVLSPTQIKNDFDSTVSRLRLEGKILTVFFLWGVCLVVCLFSYTIEIMYNSRRAAEERRS